jgi:hypothetical protein
MALTDKSVIQLNVHDLRVVEGERCLLDRRINLRLGYGRGTEVRDLIRRNKKDFEARWGPLRQRAAVVRRAQGGGTAETEYWLTKGQALWVCRKSDARNADDVMEEIIKVFLAVDAGTPIPDTPWTDALFAPERPTVEHRNDNVVEVKWKQSALGFDAPSPIVVPPNPSYTTEDDGPSYYAADDDDLDDTKARRIWRNGAPLERTSNALALDRWTDEGWHVRRRLDLAGNALMCWITSNDAISTPKKWMIPSPNGKSQILFCFTDPFPPIEVVLRTYDSLGPGPYAPIAKATLRHFLA